MRSCFSHMCSRRGPALGLQRIAQGQRNGLKKVRSKPAHAGVRAWPRDALRAGRVATQGKRAALPGLLPAVPISHPRRFPRRLGLPCAAAPRRSDRHVRGRAERERPCRVDGWSGAREHVAGRHRARGPCVRPLSDARFTLGRARREDVQGRWRYMRTQARRRNGGQNTRKQREEPTTRQRGVTRPSVHEATLFRGDSTSA